MERIELYPIYNRYTVYNDHYDGELAYPGDALGRDCMIAAFIPENPDFMRLYKNDGSKNEDWFSWNAEVYAPICGKITSVYVNDITNTPGHMNPSHASSISLQSQDGTVIVLAHIQNPMVSVGDEVKEGQLLAYVGNNGCCRNPHIHVGAYRDGKPLMIGFDATKVGEVRKTVEECYWIMGISNDEYSKLAKA